MLPLLNSGQLDLSPILNGLRGVNANLIQTNENVLVACQKTDGLSIRVQELAAQQQANQAQLKGLYDAFQAYVFKDALNTRLQQAKADLQQRTLEFEQKFGRHRRARDLATGLTKALVTGTIRQGLVTEITADELMVERNFWMPAALHALGNWIADRPAVAERALREAISRDSSKTALFFSLICRRFDRHDASHQWLTRYFQSSNPAALNRDFVVVLNGIAAGVFGSAALKLCSAICCQWFEELSLEPGFRETEVKRWTSALDDISPEVAGEEYPTLRQLSPTWPRLEYTLSHARRNEVIIRFLREIFESDLRIPNRLTAEVDELLDSLVRDHHPDELPAQMEIHRLRCLIEAGGNETTATQLIGERDGAFGIQQSFAALLSNMALFPEQTKATSGAQRYAFAWCKEYFIEACEALSARDRAVCPGSIDIQIDDWKGTTTDGGGVDEHERALSAVFTARTAAKVAGIQVPPVAFLVPLGCAALWLWSGITSAFGIGAMIAGVVIFLVLRRQTVGLRGQILEACEVERKNALATLHRCLAEVADWRRDIEREDAKLKEIKRFIEPISPEQYIGMLERGTRNVLS